MFLLTTCVNGKKCRPLDHSHEGQLHESVVGCCSDVWLVCLDRSLNDDIQEFVPVSGFESADHHGERLDVFNQGALYV